MAFKRHGLNSPPIQRTNKSKPIRPSTGATHAQGQDSGEVSRKSPHRSMGRLNERYGDKQLAAIAAMKELMQLRMPTGHPFVNIEALVKLGSKQ